MRRATFLLPILLLMLSMFSPVAQATETYILSAWGEGRVQQVTADGRLVRDYDMADYQYLCYDPSRTCWPMGIQVGEDEEGHYVVVSLTNDLSQNRGRTNPRGTPTTMVAFRLSTGEVLWSFNLLDWRGAPSFACPQSQRAEYADPARYYCTLQWIHNFEILEDGSLLMPSLLGSNVLQVLPPDTIDGVGTVLEAVNFRTDLEGYPQLNTVRRYGDKQLVTFYFDALNPDAPMTEGEGEHDAGSVQLITPDGSGGYTLDYRFPVSGGHMAGVHGAYELEPGLWVAPHGVGYGGGWGDPVPRNNPDYLGGSLAYYTLDASGQPVYLGDVAFTDPSDMWYVRDIQAVQGGYVILDSAGEHPVADDEYELDSKLVFHSAPFPDGPPDAGTTGALGNQSFTFIQPEYTIDCGSIGLFNLFVLDEEEENLPPAIKQCIIR